MRKRKELKPTPYWLEQKEKLLKHKPDNLVTPLGAPLPPIPVNKPEDGAGVPKSAITRRPQVSDFAIDPADSRYADYNVQLIKDIDDGIARGFEVPENWWMPPEAQ